MPTAPVDQHGSVLYYEDSGIPGAFNDYVTVVLIHGTCFHGAGYRPLIPFAEEHNLRLVLLNLRGYPGSTPYSDEELRRFEGSVDDPESAVRARGFEIAAFLRWFIESERIPQIRALSGSGGPGTVGGLSLLSWSGGNVQTLSMFANADKLPEETRKLLDGYLRSFIIYDPSHTSAGCVPPPSIQGVLFNQTASLEEQARQFGLVVSSYFPPFTLPDKIDSDIAYAPRPPLQDPKCLPTIAKMTEDELRDLTHPAIFERLQHAIWSPALRLIYEANAGRALCDCPQLDDGTGSKKKIWPEVKVHLLWCDMTMGEVAWAAAVLSSRHREADPDARRPMEVHKLEGANHFIHWEEPRKFVELLAKLV